MQHSYIQTMVDMLLSEWRRLCTTITDAEVKRAVNKCKFHELVKLNDPVDRFLDIVNCLYLRNCYKPMKERLATYEVSFGFVRAYYKSQAVIIIVFCEKQYT